eukprot:TRINITY_DN13685_c0_g1_i1.p1 TRINITY_DN13685_c0_g1~~TRINITY_DN13685_c0_g1_i1.p1  ORF type:complete len:969 (+),score=168.39 TRINITY_DN13685_c0_g1_i1:84-2990(+)
MRRSTNALGSRSTLLRVPEELPAIDGESNVGSQRQQRPQQLRTSSKNSLGVQGGELPAVQSPAGDSEIDDLSAGPSLVAFLHERTLGQGQRLVVDSNIKDMIEEARRTNSLEWREDNFGYSALLLACGQGHLPLATLLISARAELGAVCRLGNAALHLAARGGHGELTAFLIANRADAEAQNAKGWTALVWAAMSGHEDTVRTLLEATASADVRDEEGMTALIWATRHGHVSVMRQLLALGLDLNVTDYSGNSVMHYARNHRAALKMLSRAEEANRNLLTSAQAGNLKAAHEAIQAGAAVNVKDYDGSSPLHWAASRRDEPMVRLLVRKGADTQFDPGASSGWMQSSVLRLKTVIIQETLRDVVKANRLLLASAKEGDCLGISQALEHGACVEASEDDRRSPLSWSAGFNSWDGVVELMKAEANLLSRDVLGWTPLHWAAQNNSCEAASALHHQGADVLTRTFEGDTAQHIAAKCNHTNMLVVLRNAGADLESQDAQGRTPLQLAAMRGHCESAHYLLALGASSGARDVQGRGVISIAAAYGRHAFIKALLPDPNVPASPVPAAGKKTKDAKRKSKPNTKSKGGQKADDSGNHPATKHLVTPDKTKASNSSRPSSATSRASSKASSRDSSRTASGRDQRRGFVTKQRKTLQKTDPEPLSADSADDGLVAKSFQSRGRKGAKRNALASSPCEALLTLQSSGHTSPPYLKLFQHSQEIQKQLPRKTQLRSSDAFAEADFDGRGPMAAAAEAGHALAVAALLERRADPDAVDTQGNTPLMLAAGQCRLKALPVIEQLLAAQANGEIQNESGLQATDFAKSQEVRDFLTSHIHRLQVNRVVQNTKSSMSGKRSSAKRDKEKGGIVETPAPTPGWCPKSGRVRLDSLPQNVSPHLLEDGIRILLKSSGVPKPKHIEVLVNPITQMTTGHAYVDYGDDQLAESIACKKEFLVRQKNGVIRDLKSVPVVMEETLS